MRSSKYVLLLAFLAAAGTLAAWLWYDGFLPPAPVRAKQVISLQQPF